MNLQTTPKIALFACSLFNQEIALLTRDAEHIFDTRWFEIGLHGFMPRARAS